MTAQPAGGSQPGRPGGLGRLMAAVRPEFRADVLVFPAADPVFGGGACKVTGCRRVTASPVAACASYTPAGGPVTDLAPILQGFFTDRLARQKKASPNTVAAYRDTCKLLLTFAQEQTGKPPGPGLASPNSTPR